MSSLAIPKTYKLFIGGKFPRTESGRYREMKDGSGQFLANVSWASKKDLRNAVVAARAAQSGWAGPSAYLKGQILYRIAEVLEGRASQFVDELFLQGMSAQTAEADVRAASDLLVHYAGWSDKYTSLFSSVNPVASAHFNFSCPEPSGVVGLVAPQAGLSGLVSVLAPALVGGNTVVALASEQFPLSAISFAEVLATSDVPAGAVNILTGLREELVGGLASHMDINALLLALEEPEMRQAVEREAAENLKRVITHPDQALAPSPYHILDLQEIKTTWHPVGG
ncbi:aldehyde dehydrogenase family protein [Roseibacillus ishigakijimensis]|uniref:Aldehyde dehydrogenase n=1 Tax=Roseibacillus ishigakijimensis TaxID=454146 RepID=A0A934RQ98_9BACT|nr:aldehyde dehydrogenase family protein [Roseibacillus ishigakijimensis]MBK1832551.1 aldehyde dehydrogenase [Roseibacillus ishigakijimensis]